VHIIPMKPSSQILRNHDFRSAELLDEDAEKIRQYLKASTI
jgi:hypothetical protein